MPLQIAGQTGPQAAGDGADIPLRQGRLADLIISELHGRFYEQTFRGNVFVASPSGLLSINNASFNVATAGNTATPIVGVWNPWTSSVNLVILQATLGLTITALQATGPGPFAWTFSTGNISLTNGKTPLNRKTLAATGAQGKDMSNAVLAGLTNNLTYGWGSALGGGSLSNAAFLATAASMQTPMIASTENFDGSLIIPPGGILALQSTQTAVAHSVTAALLWEEVPL